MRKMAILLATDDWVKMDDLQEFLRNHPRTVWRTCRQYTSECLQEIPYPLNMYFFHRNIIRYRANCIEIARATGWPISEVSPEYRSDSTPYTTFIVMDRLEGIKETHISCFPKWDNPEECFRRGQLGLLRVEDIFEPR